LEGIVPVSFHLDHVGPLARGADDLDIVRAAMMGRETPPPHAEPPKALQLLRGQKGIERPDLLVANPSTPIESYRDGFGNWCNRLVAPPGQFTLSTDGVVRDSGESDAADWSVAEHPVEQLPTDSLLFLLASRYCETDSLMTEAWRLFGNTQPGRARVQAICDFVHNHLTFGYEHSRPTRTAAEAYADAAGLDLGPVLSISEGGGGGGPYPAPRAMRLDAAMEAPIERGETTVAASVTVVWVLGEAD